MKLWTVVLAACLVLAGMDAEAARFGGGKSFGRQSSNVTQRSATPPAAAPTQATAAKPGTPAPTAAAPGRPWGAMLGGVAAGLGLAWLASSLGFGEEFGQFILMALVAMLIMMAVGWFMRSRQGGARQGARPLAYQGAAAGAQPAPGAYRVENVGNDASARPWERNSTSFEAAKYAPAQGSMIGVGISGIGNWSVPADFDAEGFIKAAKANFVTMQAAWDRSDLAALRVMMTNDMVREIRVQLTEREAHSGGTANNTEVVMLEGKLLGIEDLGEDYMASVEFSGMIREQPSAGPSPFREVWNLTKPKDGSTGWLVAGVQALQ
jgi:predicted lipid-binding transport protein (Tim44 family)